ncbi:MAG: dehypoxanthine futalosine cyclase, partial [Acidobacteriota bacterium]
MKEQAVDSLLRAEQAAQGGRRLDRVSARALLQTGRLLELGELAFEMRRRLHPDGAVTYIIDRNINYTNVCI